MNFIEELQWRGMIHDMMPGIEEQLAKELTSAYVGIDPTADSLHIGHLVGVMMLKHFQVANCFGWWGNRNDWGSFRKVARKKFVG